MHDPCIILIDNKSPASPYLEPNAILYTVNTTIKYASVLITISGTSSDAFKPRIVARWESPKRPKAMPIYSGKILFDLRQPIRPKTRIIAHRTKLIRYIGSHTMFRVSLLSFVYLLMTLIYFGFF
jgi:hypothetical protein